MITVTRTFIRPNIDTPWHKDALQDTAATGNYFIKTYVDTGKCVSHTFTISPDNLSITYTSVWVTKQDYDIYAADPILVPYWNERDAYCAVHSIIVGPLTIA